MKAIERRLGRLEDGLGLKPGPAREAFRVAIHSLGRPLHLATSTCVRRLSLDGTLTEIVQFDGDGKELSKEEVDRFVERFPIHIATNS